MKSKKTNESKRVPKGSAPQGTSKGSAPQGTSTGSGSRPGKSSRHKIESSAPSDSYGLGRKPAGALK